MELIPTDTTSTPGMRVNEGQQLNQPVNNTLACEYEQKDILPCSEDHSSHFNHSEAQEVNEHFWCIYLWLCTISNQCHQVVQHLDNYARPHPPAAALQCMSATPSHCSSISESQYYHASIYIFVYFIQPFISLFVISLATSPRFCNGYSHSNFSL